MLTTAPPSDIEIYIGAKKNNVVSILHFVHTLSCLNVSHWCIAVPSLQNTLFSHPYQSIITFGGCRDDFMVVTSQQREPGVGKKSAEKLIFAMAKPKVN